MCTCLCVLIHTCVFVCEHTCVNHYSTVLCMHKFDPVESKQYCKCNKSSSSTSDCSNGLDTKTCNNSSVSWDDHPREQLQNRRPQQLDHDHGSSNDIKTGKLQLLSVLCIETSHYVCFTRATRNDWVFFDSMAERLGKSVQVIVYVKCCNYNSKDNGFNLPKVTICTHLLQEYVYGDKNMSEISSKNLPELVRRFVEDVYMCIYIQSDDD